MTANSDPHGDDDALARKRKARLGLILLVLGIAVILCGVEYVLLAVDGKLLYRFAERTTYREAKTVVHRVYPIGFAIALAGLAIAITGGRMRAKALRGPPG